LKRLLCGSNELQSPRNDQKAMNHLKTFARGILATTQAISARFRGLRLRRVLIRVGEISPGSAADLRAVSYVPHLEGHGWHGFVAHPALPLFWRKALIAIYRPHVLYMQKTRHPLNRPQLFPRLRTLIDVDDADMVDPARTELEIECYRQATGLIAGNGHLADIFKTFNANVDLIWTSTYLAPTPRAAPRTKPGKRIVAWGAGDPAGYPDEAALIRAVALALSQTFEIELWIFGAKPASPSFKALVAAYGDQQKMIRFIPRMPYVDFVKELACVDVGLNPVCLENEYNTGKSFGKLLAYMLAGVPVVTTKCLDYPVFFKHLQSAALVGNTVDEWVHAISQLISDDALSLQLATQAQRDLQRQLHTSVAARLTTVALNKCLHAPRSFATEARETP